MNEDIEELNLDEVRQKIKETLNEIDTAEAHRDSIAAQLKEVEREYHRLVKEQREIGLQLEAGRATRRLFEKREATLGRIQATEAEQKRLAAAFAEASAKYDSLTASAYWREFAFDFQIEGAKRLAVARRGILADKRGLGKTLSSIIYLEMLQAKRVLIIAINDVAPQFAQEVRHWTNGQKSVYSLNGLPPAQRAIIYPALATAEEFICLINYEAWRRDKTVIDDILKLGIDTLIIDEAHKMKEWDKLTARGISQIAFRPNHCLHCGAVDTHLGGWPESNMLDFKPEDTMSLRVFGAMSCKNCGADFEELDSTCKNVLPMTGTPILNKPQEMFSLLHICYPKLFPSEYDYLNDYCMQVAGRWYFRPGGETLLASKMSEFFVQRTREDAGIQIPPPAIIEHRLEKDPVKYERQYKAEKEMAEQALLYLPEEWDNERYDFFYMLEIILRQRQVMTYPNNIKLNLKDPDTKEIVQTFIVNLNESQKLDAIEELLKELIEEDERTIVFSQFKEPLYELQRRIGDKSVVATGDQSDDFRSRVKEDFDLKTFNNDPDRKPTWSVALCTYKAFSTGLNLNAARQMILVDSEWNPGMQDQAIGRIDRLNSTDQATVHKFIVEKSVDQFMENLMDEKRNMVGGLEGATSAADLFKQFKDFLGGF